MQSNIMYNWSLCNSAHHFDNDWQMKNYVLQTHILNDAHTEANLDTVLKEACEEWNIYSKKPALVADNTSNMSVAGVEANL